MIMLAVALMIGMHAQISGQISGATIPPARSASRTDGDEPIYTTEPVTQKVARCPAGQKLMEFDPDPAYHYMVAVAGDAMTGPNGMQMMPEHEDRWLPAGDSGDEQVLRAKPTYRCFPEDPQAATTLAPETPAEKSTDAVYRPGLQFPPNPSEGSCWESPLHDSFCYIGGAWRFQVHAEPIKWHPAETGMNACPPDQHLHAKGARFPGPDVKGAPVPVGDGRCYKDLDDSIPVEHAKKLEAKK
jgi:hypothetical protein